MSDAVIRAANVSKHYVIRHERTNDTMRDALAHGARSLWQRLRSGSSGNSREEFWALRDVSFEIQRGEVVGVVGRNGAGKSTLLKILSRITEPTQGCVELHGRIASLLEVGTGFHPELTGRDNVFLNGAILGMNRSEIRRKFDEIVAFAEVERFLDTPVKRYSSGMYVRLAFAVAAHLEPEILIVDEVLAVGDAAFQKKCLGKIQSVSHDEGRTVLLVSHNLVSVQQLCSRVLHLQGGRLVGDGPPLDQIRHYIGSRAQRPEIFSLQDAPRALSPLGRARFLSVQMDFSQSGSAWLLPFEEPLRLTFGVQVATPLDFLEIGLGLFNMQGVEIVSTLSSWQRNLGPVEPGAYTLAVDYGELELAPGNYRFGVGLKSASGLEDYLPEAFDVEIVPSERTVRPNLTTIRGAIARSAQFTLNRIS